MNIKPFGKSHTIGFLKMKETLEFRSYSRQCAWCGLAANINKIQEQRTLQSQGKPGTNITFW